MIHVFWRIWWSIYVGIVFLHNFFEMAFHPSMMDLLNDAAQEGGNRVYVIHAPQQVASEFEKERLFLNQLSVGGIMVRKKSCSIVLRARRPTP
jgi:hypothetical protein